MEFEEILTEFQNRRTDNARNGSTSTAERYTRHVRSWREWLAESRDKTPWDADYVDLRVFIISLSRDDFAPSTIGQRVSAISKFYQDCEKLAERDGYDMPDVPENPYEGLDDDDKKKLRGKTKKSKSIGNTEGVYYLGTCLPRADFATVS